MSYFDIRDTAEGNMSAEQLADAKHVVTVLGRYEDQAEHNLAFAVWGDVVTRRRDEEDIDSHELFSSVAETHGVSTTRAVQYFNYADLFTKWSDA